MIDDIIKQIDDKLPGEKIESEDFFYKKYDKTVLSDSESDSSSVDEICDAAECDGNESLLQSYLQSRVSEDQKLNDSNGYDYSSVNCDGCKKRKNNFDLTQKLTKFQIFNWFAISFYCVIIIFIGSMFKNKIF